MCNLNTAVTGLEYRVEEMESMIVQQTRLWAIKMKSNDVMYVNADGKQPLLATTKKTAESLKRGIDHYGSSQDTEIVEVKIVEVEVTLKPGSLCKTCAAFKNCNMKDASQYCSGYKKK